MSDSCTNSPASWLWQPPASCQELEGEPRQAAAHIGGWEFAEASCLRTRQTEAPRLTTEDSQAQPLRPPRTPGTGSANQLALGLEKLVHSRARLNFAARLGTRLAPGMPALLIAPHPTPTCSGLTSLWTKEPEPRSQPEGGAEASLRRHSH